MISPVKFSSRSNDRFEVVQFCVQNCPWKLNMIKIIGVYEIERQNNFSKTVKKVKYTLFRTYRVSEKRVK